MGLNVAAFNKYIQPTRPGTALAEWDMGIAMRHIAYIRDRARDRLSSRGVSWDGDASSLYRITKLVHALPAFVDAVLDLYTADHGSGPPDWFTLMDHVEARVRAGDPRLARFKRYDKIPPQTVEGGIRRLTKGTNYVGYFLDGGRPSNNVLMALVTGNTAALGVALNLTHAIARR